MKIIAHMKNGDELSYTADYTSDGDSNTFISFYRKVNPREKSYTEGSLWWKTMKTYTDYDHEVVVKIASKEISRIEYGD